MTEEEQKLASALTHKWAQYFDNQLADPPETPVLRSMATIARYARYLEEDRVRWMLQADGYYTGAFKTQAELEGLNSRTRPGWWDRFWEALGLGNKLG